MTRSESLLPREHGVYAELAFPLATGLLLGDVGLASLGFAATVVLAVLVHEPFAILTGRRGKRLYETLGQAARKRSSVLAILMTATGVTATLSSHHSARLWALVPLGFALLLAPAVIASRAKTLWGELLVAAALATSLLPVATAGRVAWPIAVAASTVWFASFMVETLTVHGIKLHHKGRGGDVRALVVGPVLGLTAIGGGLVGMWNALVSPVIVVALLPPVLVAIATSIARIHPRNLRTVGWSLVTANVVTLIVLVVML